VGVDKAGQQRRTFEVDHPGGVAPGLHDLLGRTHGEDAPVLDRHRLGGRPGVVDSDDVTTVIDRVGRLLGDRFGGCTGPDRQADNNGGEEGSSQVESHLFTSFANLREVRCNSEHPVFQGLDFEM
jgi:hypothetical protein